MIVDLGSGDDLDDRLQLESLISEFNDEGLQAESEHHQETMLRQQGNDS